MAEPLAVDPARLNLAGGKLAELVFPAAPPPITVPGSDAVSAAINATMPGIESLVSDGLPGVTAALKRTASGMSTAADIYAKADQSLGDALTRYQFGSDGQAPGAAAAAGQTATSGQLLGAPAGVASQLSQTVSQQVSAWSPRVAATVPQLVQLAPHAGPMAQQAAPIAQTISQSAQQGASSGSQGGAAPAQLASDTKPAERAQLVDETKREDEDPDRDGQAESGDETAAAGVQTVGRVSTEGATGASGARLAMPI
ncbi:hypothetical protein [Mycobacterium shinjukuense]|uniref:Uncharacterized protein n=1 Tax=Mycobacterium shinjukuense TaxID=398694 RepID=A0A7I7MVM4_9MYCO|nr:hypothetical protein [Mycobacterium shinjukuense]ORB62683.1 hypothetical protein BST45_18520 [Mycobacterium shinjukuense]BBX75573.1 hypothetical protein MSHI_34790 [Mycobacterium shinjukuense]